MTEAEALEIFKDGLLIENKIPLIAPAYELAINALEKQIAKKPTEVDERIEEDYYYLSFLCPNCGGSVTGQPYRPDYCKHCGQKLDWSEV